MDDLPHFSLFIAGQSRAVASGQTMQTINPANGQVWAVFDCAAAKDVDNAVNAALETPEWRDMSQTARGKLLYRLADFVAEHVDHLGQIETTDSGKLAAETEAQTG